MSDPVTISRIGALQLLNLSDQYANINGAKCKVHQVSNPFILIVADTGTTGTRGEAGDFIVLHPQGYPMVATYEVVWRQVEIDGLSGSK